MSSCEETPMQTQNTLERLHFSSGFGKPLHPPGGAGESGQGEGALGFPAEIATPTTQIS